MTRSIPNVVCVLCGRGFTTSAAAKRHIRNVEGGRGYALPEGEYRAYLITGTIRPPESATVLKPKMEAIPDIAYRNYYAGFYWRMGELTAERMDENDWKANMVTIVSKHQIVVDQAMRDDKRSGQP